MLRTAIGRLRLAGILEAVSFLVLLGIAVPLKYYAGQPAAVRIVGFLHGQLFVIYLVTIVNVWIERRWSLLRASVAVLAAVVPFGLFILDAKLREEARAQ